MNEFLKVFLMFFGAMFMGFLLVFLVDVIRNKWKEKKIEPLNPPNPPKEQVKCEICKHWIDKEDAQEIKIYFLGETKEYRCPIHKAPYDKEICRLNDRGYYKTIPEHEERVNEDGTPYKPSKKKR